MIPNAPKHYETHKNMSVGSNGVDRVRSLQQILTRLRGTKFCINCTSSPHFALNLRNIPNAPKHYETQQNLNLGTNGMDWVRSLRKKLQCDFVARTFALSAPIHPVLHQVCSYEMIPNAPKHYETHQNMSLGSNGVDRVRSLRKITTWLRGMNFCINCTSSPRLAPSFMKLWNDPK